MLIKLLISCIALILLREPYGLQPLRGCGYSAQGLFQAILITAAII